MSFDISDLPNPENRKPAQWVTFYLRLENAVAQNKVVTVGNRSYTAQDLDTIIAQRKQWEQNIGRVENSARSNAPVYLG